MTDSVCGYAGDRDEALVTYLYDDGGDLTTRAMFEAHLTTCVRCADDLAALRGVRVQLGHWNPPSFAPTAARSSAGGRRWWQEIPVWAQVAAALLFLGVSAAIANLDVRYDASGLSVRTGWSAPRAAAALPAVSASTPPGVASQATFGSGDAPWRADLAALERQLKAELHSAPAAAPASRNAAADAELLRRVRALIDDSEKRQQNELALHLAQAITDMNAQRQADLQRVRGALGDVQNRLGVQVLRNSQQVQQMDYLIRTSQRQ
jgi:hypothetical protein